MKKILLNLTALMLLGCAGSIISIPDHLVNDPSTMEYNIYGYYALPKTAIKIQIPVARNALKPGLVHEESIKNSKEQFDCLKCILKTNFGAESAEDTVEEDNVEEEVEEQIIRLIIQNDGTTVGAAAS